MKLAQFKMKSKLGPLYLVASERGLRGVFWNRQDTRLLRELRPESRPESFLLDAVREIEEFLDGKRRGFGFPLDLAGTPFQLKVWSEVSRIGYGKTRSYQEIAQKLGNPKAARAVGTANGKNPVCLVIPCHRVIASDGTLGGYSGGIAIKRRLLALERGRE